jgi:hypothetical protein
MQGFAHVDWEETFRQLGETPPFEQHVDHQQRHTHRMLLSATLKTGRPIR